jgi:hypothetical protein
MSTICWARSNKPGKSTLENRCHAAHVSAKRSLDFARLLRAIVHARRHVIEVARHAVVGRRRLTVRTVRATPIQLVGAIIEALSLAVVLRRIVKHRLTADLAAGEFGVTVRTAERGICRGRGDRRVQPQKNRKNHHGHGPTDPAQVWSFHGPFFSCVRIVTRSESVDSKPGSVILKKPSTSFLVWPMYAPSHALMMVPSREMTSVCGVVPRP